MKNIISYFSICLLFLASCVSNETLSPGRTVEESDEIILNLSTPIDAKTRAEEGYYLRYVAKIFQITTGTDFSANSMQRADILNNNDNPEENKIVFKVDPNKKYVIFVFADYIKDNFKKSDDSYPDHFYDTSANNGTITIKTTPGSNSDKLSAEFFNNDNYDCFNVYDTIHKTTLKKELNLKLTRAVAKVQWKDNSENPGKIKNFKFSFFNVGKALFQPTNAIMGVKDWSNFTLEKSELREIEDENIILFYYSFAKRQNVSPKQYLSAKFTISIDENSNTKELECSNIPVYNNVKTTISGLLIPQTIVENPDDEKKSEEGDVILDLSTAQDWDNDLNMEIE